MKKIAAILVLIAVGVTGVSADVVLTSRTEVINYGGEDYTVITIGAQESLGGVVSGFVGPNDSVGVVSGHDSSLNQMWYLDVLDTPTLDNAALLAGAAAVDTHFLFLNDDMLVPPGLGFSPTEDLAGTHITGAFGVAPSKVANSVDFIQVAFAGSMPELTLKEGETAGVALYSFSVTYKEPAAKGSEQSFFSGAIIPEPATMTLLAIGGLGALIRRKRR